MARFAGKPLQVYLEAEQEHVLRAAARREHVSLAELVRRSIRCYLEQQVPPESHPSLGLIGLGHSGRPDLSADHDQLVAGQATAAPLGE